MSRKYNGGMEVGTGFDVQSNRPLDERDIVVGTSRLPLRQEVAAIRTEAVPNRR